MTTSREFLELAMSGEEITPVHLDSLVAERVREDEYIEYKSGAIFQKSNKDLSRMIRQYMSGFANSDGGVLIIGVEEDKQKTRLGAFESRPTKVDGCNDRRISGDLASWAAECVKDIGARFSPLPRFRVVAHPVGEVLVCAVWRSYNLVPVYEDGREVHYLRIGEHMQAASDFLVADLRLGRRARPSLEVRNAYVRNLSRVTMQPDRMQIFLQFDLVAEVENTGLVWAEGSRYGVVVVGSAEWVGSPPKIPISLNEYIDLQAVQLQVGAVWRDGRPFVFRGARSLEKPFDTAVIEHTLQVPLVHYGKVHSYVWRAGMFLLARDCPPVWYQIDLRIDRALNELLRPPRQDLPGLPPDWEGFSIRRVTSERPVVGWIRLPDTE